MADRAKGRARVFLACTTDATATAEALRRLLVQTVDVTLWAAEAIARPGSAVARLLAQARLHDFLILVLGDGDLAPRRGRTPRRTVLFEAGLLVGAMGGSRSLVAWAPGRAASRLGLPRDLFDGAFAPPLFELREGEETLAAAAMGAVIAERWALAPPALLPSAGIAIGYFRNFVKPVSDYLAGDEVVIGDQRFSGPDFDFTFDLVIPATLEDAAPAGQQRFWARNAGRLIDRSLSIGRRYPFFVRTGAAANPLRVVDFPTPLAASVDAVALVLRGEGEDRDDARALLGAREIDNFETTLAALITADPRIARHARLRRLGSDEDLILD